MAASPRDLCTLAEVKALLGLRPEQTANDTQLERWIREVSELIYLHTEREFVAVNATGSPPVVVAESRTVFSDGGQILRLGDVTVLNSLTVGGALVAGADYLSLPQPREPLRPIRGVQWVNGPWLEVGGQVVVNAVWGFPAVPESVRGAAIRQVAILYRRWISRRGESGQSAPAAVPAATILDVTPELELWRDVGV